MNRNRSYVPYLLGWLSGFHRPTRQPPARLTRSVSEHRERILANAEKQERRRQRNLRNLATRQQ